MISIIEKEMAKNSAFLQKEINIRNTDKVTVVLKTSMSNVPPSRSDVLPRNTAALVVIDQFLLNLGTLMIIENAYNTADMKYSVYPVAVQAKDRRDSVRN